MNRDMPFESARGGQAPLPAEVHTDTRVSHVTPRRRRPSVDGTTAPPPRASSPQRATTARTAILCVVLLAALAAVLIPALRTAMASMKGTSSVGGAVGDVLLQGGMPPTNGSLWGGGPSDTTRPPQDTEENTTAPDTVDTLADESHESRESGENGDSTDPTESDLWAGDSLPHESESLPAEPDTLPDTASPAETADPGSDETADPSETETSGEDDTLPAETVPEGVIPISRQNLSEPTRGSGYLINTAGDLPLSLPTGRPWASADVPTVLIVNTHPYEGYSEGGDWYDPATGGLALTDSPNDPNGVVALSVDLTRRLREMGVTVIHLRVAVGEGETASAIYDRTEELVRYYCDLYPAIGLVLDLRRTAELTADGHILATEGHLSDAPTAQVRLSVNGTRASETAARDLSVALAIRERLWATDPSISRPTHVRPGEGLVADRGDLTTLTVDVGSAGNTYAEAAAVMAPLAEAIAAVVMQP